MVPTIFDPRITEAFFKANKFKLEDTVIMACYGGSVSQGTNLEPLEGSSDIDMFAVVIPPLNRIVGFSQFDVWENKTDELDVTVFSISKYIGLLLKNNATYLSTLYLRQEHYMVQKEHFLAICSSREKFLSKKVVYSLLEYSNEQERRMIEKTLHRDMGEKRRALIEKFGYDTKMAAHLVRLLDMANEALETGQFNVFRDGASAFHLKSIKKGEVKFDHVMSLVKDLRMEVEAKLDSQVLQDKPDAEFADRLLTEIIAHTIRNQK